MINPIEVRRLDSNEVGSIDGLQGHAKALLNNYRESDHRIWMTRALSDVRAGKRVALGAFLEINGISTLVASAILSRSVRQSYVELKNFIIVTPILPQGVSASAITEQFLLGIERFAAARGFSSIETELPADLTPEVSFFLQKKYRVADVRKSRYKNQDRHYVLEKAIQRLYLGDPFDGLIIARWLIYEYFGFSRSSGEQVMPASLGERLIKNSFTFSIAPQREEASTLGLYGACLFEYQDAPIEPSQLEAFASSVYDLKIVVATRSRDTYLSASTPAGIRVFDVHSLIAALGKESTAGLLQVQRQDIRGLLVVVGSSTQARMLEEKRPFAYVAGGGLGHILSTGTALDDSKLFAVFCIEKIDSSSKIKYEIWGHSKIVDLNMVPQDSIREALETSDIERLSPGDTQYYSNNEFAANHSEAQQIALMKLRPVEELETPIDVFDESRISPEIVSYLKAHEKFGIISCYLDKSSVLEITSADRRTGKSLSTASTASIPSKDQAMLETIISAVQSIGALSNVSASTAIQVKKLVASLKKSDEPKPQGSVMGQLVAATDGQLRDLVQQFTDASKAGTFTAIERSSHGRLIASQALKLLKAASPIKGQIPEYDELIAFFEAQANAQ